MLAMPLHKQVNSASLDSKNIPLKLALRQQFQNGELTIRNLRKLFASAFTNLRNDTLETLGKLLYKANYLELETLA